MSLNDGGFETPDPNTGLGSAADAAEEARFERAEEAVHKAGPRRPYRAFGDESQNIAALTEQIASLAELSREQRKRDGMRMRILGELAILAVSEGQRERLPDPGPDSGGGAAPGPGAASGLEKGAAAVLQASSGNPRDTVAYRSARAEAAAVTGLSELTVEKHMMLAEGLKDQYPDTLASLEDGNISLAHATALHDEGMIVGVLGIDDTEEIAAARKSYEAAALDRAVRMSANRFRHYLKGLAEQYALENLEDRHARALKERDVWVMPKEDGMAELRVLTTATQAYAVRDRANQLAQEVLAVERLTEEEKAEAEAAESAEVAANPESDGVCAKHQLAERVEEQQRKISQRRLRGEARADVCIDLLLNGTEESASGRIGVGITANVQVVTYDPMLKEKLRILNPFLEHAERVRADKSEESAKFTPLRQPFPNLDGYGPIPETAAIELMVTDRSTGASVPWDVLVAHPETGDLLSIDRYSPTAAMRRFIQARDRHCRFPGCRANVYRCDIDHTVDAALGGETAVWNLAALCRGHHVLKHHSGWKIKQREYGICEFVSPTGLVYTEEPISRVMFRAMKYPLADEPADESAENSAEGTAPPETSQETDPGDPGDPGDDWQPF